MTSDNNCAFLRTVTACAVFLTCLSAVLLYNATVDEMQRLHDEVHALRSDVLDLQKKLNTRSKNTEGSHYLGSEGSNSNVDDDGDDEEDDDDNDGDEKNIANKDINAYHVNSDFNQEDNQVHDLLWRMLHHRSRRRAGQPKENRQKKPKRKFRTQAVLLKTAAGYQNPRDIFTHWVYADWGNKTTKAIKDKFKLGVKTNELGKVIIPKDGLYYIFVQVTFSGHSSHEFAIMKENKHGNVTEEISCCIIIPKHSDEKPNNYILRTCHTSNLVLVEKKDKIYVKNKIQGSAVHFEPAYTFLGMFKLR
ncbi:uncharacterized protein LOC135479524 isoform X2 [Liolophura sinensis]|uniref:uncharacterized protein LOC135479524 isoform X2 n=1 Tax=Liolophura sinensis TaxID=3198878 RepID=UPI003158387B